jgi:hypothetical protein
MSLKQEEVLPRQLQLKLCDDDTVGATVRTRWVSPTRTKDRSHSGRSDEQQTHSSDVHYTHNTRAVRVY